LRITAHGFQIFYANNFGTKYAGNIGYHSCEVDDVLNIVSVNRVSTFHLKMRTLFDCRVCSVYSGEFDP